MKTPQTEIIVLLIIVRSSDVVMQNILHLTSFISIYFLSQYLKLFISFGVVSCSRTGSFLGQTDRLMSNS